MEFEIKDLSSQLINATTINKSKLEELDNNSEKSDEDDEEYKVKSMDDIKNIDEAKKVINQLEAEVSIDK